MDRRHFLNLLSSSGLGLLVLEVTGCGGAATVGVLTADGDIMVYDIVMKGWSVLGSGFLGDCGNLKAKTIADKKAVSLDYEQDPHGHKINLTPEHFEKLIKGEKIEVLTTEAQGHHHNVVIDPRNKVPGSQGVAIVPPQPTQPQDQLYARLPEGEKPDLYVAASTDLNEGSVQICVDEAARCEADQTLWAPMKRHAPRADRQIFVNERALNLDISKSEQLVVVRGTRKSDSKLLKFILKMVNNKPNG